MKEIDDAYRRGDLKKVSKDDGTYWIEDTEGGNGLCIYSDKSNVTYHSRRKNWKACGFPCRETWPSGKNYYEFITSKKTRIGPYVFFGSS